MGHKTRATCKENYPVSTVIVHSTVFYASDFVIDVLTATFKSDY
jgi:hypothetical protein